MSTMASQITSASIVYSTVCSGPYQRKHQKPSVTGLCVGNSPVTGEFPSQRASNAENVSIWWRRYAERQHFRAIPGISIGDSSNFSDKLPWLFHHDHAYRKAMILKLRYLGVMHWLWVLLDDYLAIPTLYIYIYIYVCIIYIGFPDPRLVDGRMTQDASVCFDNKVYLRLMQG